MTRAMSKATLSLSLPGLRDIRFVAASCHQQKHDLSYRLAKEKTID